jgi:fatty acid desaturase
VTTETPPLSVTRIPDPHEPVPRVAWPTLALLIVGIGLWAFSSGMWLAHIWPWWISTLLNALASYLLFTVAHDAAHHAAAGDSGINEWIGRLATPFFAPHASFRVWRFVHMQHHRYTNHDDGRDPDGYTMAGPSWQRPLRWLTVDLQYMFFYAPRLRGRPRSELYEQFAALGLLVSLTAVALATGHVIDIIVLLYLPCRLAILYLGWAFDYLPHHRLHHTPSQDRFKTTRNRIGLERLLSPILLYQNYHLVHHLHPIVPFYRYLAVWRRNEDDYLDGDPALSTVRGRELTTEEYRRIRQLVEHP